VPLPTSNSDYRTVVHCECCELRAAAAKSNRAEWAIMRHYGEFQTLQHWHVREVYDTVATHTLAAH
jgi:hypothetical protein